MAYVQSLSLALVVFTTMTRTQNITTYLPSTTQHYESTKFESTSFNDAFALCHTLNQYGCNPTSLPAIVELYINGGIDGYTLPTDPCEFDSINMTWIWTQVDISVLNLVSDNSYFSTMPCQVLVQMPEVLEQRDILYLIEEDYYFNDANTGECDTANTDNNPYNVTICTYNTTHNNTVDDDNSTNSYDSCPNDNRCIYPFVLTDRETSALADFGMCHCWPSCQFRPFGGDIGTLDTFNTSCCWISMVLILGYCINSYFEFKKVRSIDQQKLSDLPLTFDIPFICVGALFCFDLSLLLPLVVGKEFSTCSADGSTVYGRDLPQSSWPCFIQGSMIYLSLFTMYTYFMVLSFAVWRYVYRPLKPLYGIKKRYWHLAIWTYILGFYSGLVSQIPKATVGVNTILGICGSSLVATKESYIFNWYPIIFTVIVFVIVSPLTIYQIYKVVHHKSLMNQSLESYNKELINLSIRLVLYSFFLCASCICFLYVIGETLFNMDTWDRVISKYVECVVLENYLSDIGLSGDDSKCVLDPDKELAVATFYMTGVIVLLASSASFILSCSNARYSDWKRAETRVVRMLSLSRSKGSGVDEEVGSRQNTKEFSNVDFSKTDVGSKRSGRRWTRTQTGTGTGSGSGDRRVQIDVNSDTELTQTVPKLDTNGVSNINFAITPDIDEEPVAEFMAAQAGVAHSPSPPATSMSDRRSNSLIELIKTDKTTNK